MKTSNFIVLLYLIMTIIIYFETNTKGVVIMLIYITLLLTIFVRKYFSTLGD
jgi:hypothetical protein